MSTKAQREIAHKLRIFAHSEQSGNISFTCRYFGISRDTFYRWKKNYKQKGEAGLINSKPCPENPKLRTPKASGGPGSSTCLYQATNTTFKW